MSLIFMLHKDLIWIDRYIERYMIYDKFRNTDVQTGEDICGPELGQIKLIIIIINNLPSTFYNFFEKQNKIKFAKQNKTEQNVCKRNKTKKQNFWKQDKTTKNFEKTKQNIIC